MSRAAWLAIALAAAGCAESNSATVVEIPPPAQADVPAPVVAAPPPAAREAVPGLVGEWRGSYECAQGATNLALHVTRVSPEVAAVFEFSHEGSGASGAYELRGQLGGSGEVSLVPTGWIDRPPGYVMVGMRGTVSGDVFRGTITEPSCRGFQVRRVR
ncbi:MAG TPA: hypothetical protein VLM85_02105 [Polyangiaceae bacterium]|nr:hypothetical protein [Polyangiaceae bacterium]